MPPPLMVTVSVNVTVPLEGTINEVAVEELPGVPTVTVCVPVPVVGDTGPAAPAL